MENLPYTKANVRQGIKIAKDFDLPIQYAINARRRYLTDELEMLDLEIAFYDDYEGDAVNEFFCLLNYSELTLRQAKAKKELRDMKNVTIRKPGITDEMIEQAMAYPVEQLVEFKRGKAQAFCHNDKNPSAYHATRTNRLNCPVCGKSFNTINILMERDGFSFKDAVTSLSNR